MEDKKAMVLEQLQRMQERARGGMFGRLRERHELKKQIELKDREIEALKGSNRLYELESENDSRVKMLLREEVAKLARENTELEGRKNTLESELAKTYAELDEVKTENGYLREKNGELEAKFTQLKKDHENLKAEEDAHWAQLVAIMKAHPEFFPESEGVDEDDDPDGIVYRGLAR